VWVVVGVAGALVGAPGLSIITLLLYKVIEPEAFGSGQFVMVFAFTVPLGFLLGSVTSLVVRLAKRRHRTRAGWIAAVGGAAILALATAIVWGSADSRGRGFAQLMSTLLSLWIGPSWLAAAALTTWGTCQLVIRPELPGRF